MMTRIPTALTFIGTIKEIWRYPISSTGGEQLTSVDIKVDGITGDRTWCLADAATRHPAAPEKDARWRPILFLQSRLRLETPEIGFPDGTWFPVENETLDAKLSDYFEFEVVALPYAKAIVKMPEKLGVVTNRYEPSPVHLLTTGSLSHLAKLLGEKAIDSRRFRPTVLLDTFGETGFLEASWVGRQLQAGQTVLDVHEETKRCGMTLVAQPGIPENADVLRTILRQNKRNLGIYCRIDSPGTICVGDDVWLLPLPRQPPGID